MDPFFAEISPPTQGLRAIHHGWRVRVRDGAFSLSTQDETGAGLLLELHDVVLYGTRERPLGSSTDRYARELEYAWRRHGLDFVESMKGVWLWCVWERGPGRLSVFRDALGVLPLGFCKASEGAWRVSNELGTLLGSSPRRPSRQRLVQTLLNSIDPSDASDFLEGQARVHPGHMAQFGRVSTQTRWWSPEVQSARPVTLDDAQHALHCALETVSGEYSLEHTKVLLSGGIDSSAVAWYASRRMPALRTASLVFPTLPTCDETEVIERYERAFGVRGQHVNVEDVWPLQDLELYDNFLSEGPQLSPDEGYLSVFFARALQGSTGVGFLGGDHADALLENLPTLFFRRLMKPEFRWNWGAWMKNASSSYITKQLLWGMGRQLMKPEGWRRARGVREWLSLGRRRPEWLHPDVSMSESLYWDRHASRYFDEPSSLGVYKRDMSHGWEWELYSRGRLRNLRRASTWGTSPFFDRRLWEVVVPWGPELLWGFSRGKGMLLDKWALRTLLQRRAGYPNPLAMRPKQTSFDKLIEKGLLVHEMAKVRGLLQEMRLEEMRLVQARPLREMAEVMYQRALESFPAGPPVQVFPLWRVLTLELWLRALEK